MELQRDLRVKDVEQQLVGTVTLVSGSRCRVEFDNGFIGIYNTKDDDRLVPPVGYYEWMRLMKLRAEAVEKQLGALRFARGRWLNGMTDDQGGAYEMSKAAADLLRTLGMVK